MRTLEIALSCDQPNDHRFLDEILMDFKLARIVVRHENPLDLLLRDTISWYAVPKPPDAVIAAYRLPFRDLKVIGDLKKRQSYQYVPIFLFVDEDISHTRRKFLEFGVNQVLRWPSTDDQVKEQVLKWVKRVFLDTQLRSAV